MTREKDAKEILKIVDVVEECPCFPYCVDCLIKLENATSYEFKNPEEAVKFLMERRMSKFTYFRSPDNSRWGKYVLTSPEFKKVEDLVKWDSDRK